MWFHRSRDPALARSTSIARKVVVVFTVFGVSWIFVTDVLLYRLVDDQMLHGRIETLKGWTFVLITAGILYGVTHRDVHELARANAKTRAVLCSISDGVLTLDEDGYIADVNPAAARLLGVEDANELLGMGPERFSRRFHVTRPDGRVVDPHDYVSQRAARGEEPRPYKAVLHPPGRAPIVLIVTGAPVRPMAGGPVNGAVSVLHDVTPFEDIDRMRDSFVSSAAHTLKTPIAVIRAQLELIQHGSPTSASLAAEIISRQCGRISRITENLLVLARIRSHSLQLAPEAVDISGVVEDAAKAMKHAAADHGVRTMTRARPIVFADRNRLALVVRDLIDLAYRRARPYTDVHVCVDQLDSQGRVTVTYEPVTPSAANEHDDASGYGGLRLEKYVCEELVAAANGALGSVLDDGRYRRDWLTIPTIGGDLHA